MDRPLIRTDRSVREDDQWMLDRWSPPSSHRVRLVYLDQTHPDGYSGTTVDRSYRTECACGWRSVEGEMPVLDTCPVGLALRDREQRQRRSFERVEWLPLDKS